MTAFGIDIGGTGIKGGCVNLRTGRLAGERFRLLTPNPATPAAVADTVKQIVDHFKWDGSLGCTFPAIVKNGVVLSAAHVDPSWIKVDAAGAFSSVTGRPVRVINDADAAGVAEMRYGAGRGQRGMVLMLTFGTGIGSSLFYEGTLVPNMQLGHLSVRGREAEARASDAVRVNKGFGWKKWIHRVNEYLAALEVISAPDLIIVGGGVSKHAQSFLQRLEARAPIVLARLENEAGIVGASMVSPKGKATRA